MADDHYRYIDTAHVLHGERSRRIYRLGDRVRVQVLRVDTERRLIDLGLVEQLEALRADPLSPDRTRSRVRPKSDRRRHTSRQPARRQSRRR
jgi:ribonuclease R